MTTKPKHPLFPPKIGDRVADLNTKLAYLKTNAPRLGITSADINALETQVNALNSAQALVNNKDTRTKLDTVKRDVALEAAMESARKVIEYYVEHNPNATPVDYEALNVPQPGPHPPLPMTKREPGLWHIYSKSFAVYAPYYDQETEKSAKPEGVQAIEVYMKVGGEPPKDHTEMTERKVSTGSPVFIRFEEEHENKVLYLMFRRIGTRGDYSPRTGIYTVIIVR